MISEIEIDGRISAMMQQRNAAMDQVVVLAGQIAVKDAKIAELTAKVSESEAKIEMDLEDEEAEGERAADS